MRSRRRSRKEPKETSSRRLRKTEVLTAIDDDVKKIRWYEKINKVTEKAATNEHEVKFDDEMRSRVMKVSLNVFSLK